MVGQGIQNSIDEGYDTRASTPTSRTHLKDDVLDTTLSSELHITEEGSKDSYPTKHNENIDESESEDTLNVSYKTCPEYEDMDEDALSVLYETCQSEQDIEDELEDLEVMGTFQPDIAIYKQVDECVRKNTLSTLLNTRHQASTSPLYSDETVAKGMIKESLELIALGKDKKIMFGMPCDVFSENTSLIDFLVRNLHILKTPELSTYERYQLGSVNIYFNQR